MSRFVYLCVFASLLLAPVQLWAQTSTTTTLSISATSVLSQTAVALTATVKAGSKPVTPGLVKFCNANASNCFGLALLGQTQLLSNGIATLNLALPPGTHSIKAEFAGTKTDAPSSSNAEILTVTPRYSQDAFTSVNATANAPYTFTATVEGFGTQSVTSQVSFVDTSNGNLPLGTAALPAGTTAHSFFPAEAMFAAGATPGSEPVALAVGDINGDGYPDMVIGLLSPNGNGQSTLAVALTSGPNGAYRLVSSLNLPSSVNGVTAIAEGDFNDDGKLDVAVVSGNANSVTILFGDGTGNLNYTGASFPTGINPNSIAVADLNGDGNLDLAITNQFSSNVRILLGNGQGGFSQASSPQTDSYPYSIAAGDFNGDGIPDLAIANYFGFDVTVLLGRGDGTFTAAPSPAAGVYPDGIAVGDFNGDGKQDLAVVNAYSKNITILLGDGKGNFAATAVSPATGNNPDSVTIADFNNDGIDDLAVANSSDNTVIVYYGKGDGTFPAGAAQTIQLPFGTVPYAVAALDAYGSPDEDLLVAEFGSNTALLISNSIATTATATLSGVKVPGGGTHNIMATYLGNSSYGSSYGNVSVAGTPIGTNTTLTVEPSGTVAVGKTVQLTATVSPGSVGKLTPGGTVSLYNGTQLLTMLPVVNGSAFVNLQTIAGTESVSARYSGDTNFAGSPSAPVTITAITPTASTTALAVSSNSVSEGTIVTLTATVKDSGQPVTQGSVKFCNALAKSCQDAAVLGTAHLNTTGTTTIKMALPFGPNSLKAVFSGTNGVSPSSSTAQTVTVAAPSTIGTTTGLTISGTAGNYTLTAAVTGSWVAPAGIVSFVDTSNKNLVLSSQGLRKGVPAYTQSATLPTGINPQSIVVADFNGDGKPDFAVADVFSNNIKIYLGNGAGTFSAVSLPITGTPNFNQPTQMGAADFNGDGKLDLAVTNYLGGDVIILLGNGDGTFTVKSTPSVGGHPVGIAAADYNGDGKLDLAVTNFATNNVNILLGNGDGTFSLNPVSSATGRSPIAIATADFNGDGAPDLAIVNQESNSVTILLGLGDGEFTLAAPVATGNVPNAIAVADLDGNGTPDLAVVNYQDQTATIFGGNGNGTFAQRVTFNTGAGPGSIVAANLNGDALPDLVITNSGGSSLTLVLGPITGLPTLQTVPVASGSIPVPIAAGDFNQDGVTDLAVGDTASQVVHILLNSSLTSYAVASGVSVPGSGTHQLEANYLGAVPDLPSTSAPMPATATPIAATLSASVPGKTSGRGVAVR